MRRTLSLYREYNRDWHNKKVDVSFCDSEMRYHFGIPKEVDRIWLVTSDKKPRHCTHWYSVVGKSDRMGGLVWYFGPDYPEGTGTSPWDREFDNYLTKHFRKHKKAYGWIEYEELKC